MSSELRKALLKRNNGEKLQHFNKPFDVFKANDNGHFALNQGKLGKLDSNRPQRPSWNTAVANHEIMNNILEDERYSQNMGGSPKDIAQHTELDVDGEIVSDEVKENWQKSFQHNVKVRLSSATFNCYYSLPSGSLENTRTTPIFVFHHGAGSSALSFARLSQELYQRHQSQCACFAFDARGHGQTTDLKDKNYDREHFVEDFIEIMRWADSICETTIPEHKRSYVMVGHSLGGSVCTFAFDHLDARLKKNLVGIAMLDIVEDVAKKALRNVRAFLMKTPNSFKDYSDAVKWHVNHKLSRNMQSAEIAIPPLFRSQGACVVRITNLVDFESDWETWFPGLSAKFVAIPTHKLLILAGHDSLDKELMIGQMQGKYQLVVFQDSGHFIQEDCPAKAAITLLDFWERNENRNFVIKSNWGERKMTRD